MVSNSIQFLDFCYGLEILLQIYLYFVTNSESD